MTLCDFFFCGWENIHDKEMFFSFSIYPVNYSSVFRFLISIRQTTESNPSIISHRFNFILKPLSLVSCLWFLLPCACALFFVWICFVCFCIQALFSDNAILLQCVRFCPRNRPATDPRPHGRLEATLRHTTGYLLWSPTHTLQHLQAITKVRAVLWRATPLRLFRLFQCRAPLFSMFSVEKAKMSKSRGGGPVSSAASLSLQLWSYLRAGFLPATHPVLRY